MRLMLTSALSFAIAVTACARLAPPDADGSGGISSGNIATDIVRYTNDARIKNGLKPVTSHPKLMEAARIHAEQMASYRQMEHTISGAKYPNLAARLDAVGYLFGNAAENIAWNEPNARAVVSGWMNSTSHRTNILDTRLTEMGAAVARSSNGETYWIQVFGRPR